MEKRYKVYGMADNVNSTDSSMAEFSLVDKAATLFERSSGFRLRRDPTTGKCQVLPGAAQTLGGGEAPCNRRTTPTQTFS